MTYPSPNFNEYGWFHPTLYVTCDYLSILGLQLIHLSKSGPESFSGRLTDSWNQRIRLINWTLRGVVNVQYWNTTQQLISSCYSFPVIHQILKTKIKWQLLIHGGEGCWCNVKCISFTPNLVIDAWSIFCEIHSGKCHRTSLTIIVKSLI